MKGGGGGWAVGERGKGMERSSQGIQSLYGMDLGDILRSAVVRYNHTEDILSASDRKAREGGRYVRVLLGFLQF